MSDPARSRTPFARALTVAVLAFAGTQTGGGSSSAWGQREPRTPRPGEGIEAVPADSFRDGGTSALLNAVVPPPPPPPPPAPAAPCPEPPRCLPESDLSQVAWIVAGLSSAAMLVAGWWGVTQMRRTRIYREELSRIGILQRTSAIRTGRKLGEVQMPPHGLGKRPEGTSGAASTSTAPAPAAPAAHEGSGASEGTGGLNPPVPLPARSAFQLRPAVPFAAPRVEPPAAPAPRDVRDEAEARLAMAQAQLPLLAVVRSVEEWFRLPEYQATLVATSTRGLLDRLYRGVVAAAATFQALPEARIFPVTADAIDDELERYWEQVYESLDDVSRLAALASSDEGRRVLGTAPRGETVRDQLERLLEAAHGYLASDGRRPIFTEPLVTDFDRRLHVAVESRRVEGVPPGKVLSVVRSGISREGRPLRKPEVVVSA